MQLQTVTPDRLTPAQHQGRLAALGRLRAYIDAGRFPRNHSARPATPVFVDEAGTHCAMGQLLSDLGAQDVVQRIHQARNLETVPVLADEPGLGDWLATHGMTPEEGALVQPTYFYCQPILPCGLNPGPAYDAVLSRSDAGAPWRSTPIRVLRGANVVCVGEQTRWGYYDSELVWPPDTVLGEPFSLAHDGTGWVSAADANCAERPRAVDSDRLIVDQAACIASLAQRDLRWLAVECFHSGWELERKLRCNPDGRYRANLLPPRGTMRSALDMWFSSIRVDPTDAGIDLSGYDAMEQRLWDLSDDGGLPLNSGVLPVLAWDGGLVVLDQACLDARDAGTQNVDAGVDAGTPEVDAGTPFDAGTPVEQDGGGGGMPVVDAGPLPAADAGNEPTMPPGGCGCASADVLSALALGVLFLKRRLKLS